MKNYELREIMEKDLEKVKEKSINRILDNIEKMYIYKDNNFLLINSLDEKDEIIDELKNGEIKKVYLDINSKKNIENNRTKLTTTECKGAVILNSTLVGSVNIEYDKIFILDSKLSGEKTRILYCVVVEEGSLVIESALALVHLKGATSLDSNLNFVKMEKGSLLNSNSFLANGIYIKEDVMIGPNCNMIINTYEYHRPLEYFSGNSDLENGALLIEENVWFGAGVNVIKYANIGAWSLVAAGSVIAEDVPEFTLAMTKKQRSILSRIAGIEKDEERLMKILSLDYPDSAGTGRLYTWIKDILKEKENSDIYLRIFYMYAHSEFVRTEKKVTVRGEKYNFLYNENFFEFLSPEKVVIDIENNEIQIEYKNYYKSIEGLRIEFLKKLMNFAKVEQKNEKKYIAKFDNEILEKFNEIDRIFNSVIDKVIDSFQISKEEYILECASL